jgi:hypothetical protein
MTRHHVSMDAHLMFGQHKIHVFEVLCRRQNRQMTCPDA